MSGQQERIGYFDSNTDIAESRACGRFSNREDSLVGVATVAEWATCIQGKMKMALQRVVEAGLVLGHSSR